MHVIAIIGQIILGAYFLYNGIQHFTGLKMRAGYAASKGVPSPTVAVAGSGALLAIGGLSILTGAFIWWGILALVIFLVIVTLKMHQFWKISDPMARMGESINFTKNFALLGSLLILWDVGTLAYSLF